MTPFFQIIQGEIDVTSRAGGGNVSLSITDGVGLDSDTIDYSISDENGVIAPPRTGVDVRVIGGYRERAARDFGRFTIDEVTLSGYPQIIAVNGQSVGARTAVKQRRSESFKGRDFSTYGTLIEKLAQRNGLTAVIDPEIASKSLEYEAQTEEHDMAFLSRLGAEKSFGFTIKDKRLIITKKGLGKSASGLLLPVIDIVFGENLKAYSVSRKDRPQYAKVKAKWFDRDKAENKEVDAASSSAGPEYLIRQVFKTEEEAVDAVKAKAADLKRGAATAEFTIVGNEQARAEAFARVSGVRSLVDGEWRSTNVGHSFDASGGYETTVTCELPGGSGETEDGS